MKKIILIFILMTNHNCFTQETMIYESEIEAYRKCLIHNTFIFCKIITELLKYYQVPRICNVESHKCENDFYNKNNIIRLKLYNKNLTTEEIIQLKNETFNLLIISSNSAGIKKGINLYKIILRGLEFQEKSTYDFFNKFHSIITRLMIKCHCEFELYKQNHSLYQSINSIDYSKDFPDFDEICEKKEDAINLLNEFHNLIISKNKKNKTTHNPYLLFLNEWFKYDFDHRYAFNIKRAK
ncbi:MAG: hypothetical protein P4L22_05610 [Candidatus Babeliales bacterium]|nr:hypothetical protein [Candidatus Babeliales bacterium]